MFVTSQYVQIDGPQIKRKSGSEQLKIYGFYATVALKKGRMGQSSIHSAVNLDGHDPYTRRLETTELTMRSTIVYTD